MVLFILTSLLFTQTQLSVSPMLIEQSLAPGAKRQFKFTIVNESKWDTTTLALYPSDIIETEDGSYQTVATDKGFSSCAGWIKLKDNDTLIILKPNSGAEIVGLIEVPRGVKGGRYGAVVIETRLPPNSKQYRTRMSVFFEVTIKPLTKPKATITNIKLEPPEKLKRFMFMGPFKDALAVLVAVKNEGDIHLSAKGTLILKNKKGGKINEYPLGGGRGIILPYTTVDMASVIKKPPAGEYIAEAMIRYGTGSPAKARIPFVISTEKVQTKGVLSSTMPLAITIKPEKIELTILPNAFRSHTIILHNGETFDVKVSAGTKQLTNDESGELFTTDTGFAKWTCSEWIEIDPEEFILKAGERKPVKVKMQIPSDINQGEKYSQIVFNISKDTILPTPFELPVFLNYPGHSGEGIKVDNVKLVATKPAYFNIHVKNIGDVKLKPFGKIIIESKRMIPGTESENTAKIGEFPLKEIKGYVLPDRTLRIEAEGPAKLENGKYNIKVEIEYGKGKFSTFEKEIKI